MKKIVKDCEMLQQPMPNKSPSVCSDVQCNLLIWSPASKQPTNSVMEKVQMNTSFSSVNIWSWAESFSISETASLQESSMNMWVCNCAWLLSHFHISLSYNLMWLKQEAFCSCLVYMFRVCVYVCMLACTVCTAVACVRLYAWKPGAQKQPLAKYSS